MSTAKSEKVARINDKGDYKVQTSTRREIVFVIISILIAVIIWMYTIQSDSSSHSYTGKMIDIRYPSSDVMADRVLSIETALVDFKVMGNKTVISNLNDVDLRVYADLTGISDVGVYEIPIIFEANSSIYFYGKSAETITVTVTEK
ncbi:MAG: hypothetical protein MJ101_02955 [Clostridia bacterium]|nr:hypothetical protein [Clostridia bacterium]